jgi:hypothetical protein
MLGSSNSNQETILFTDALFDAIVIEVAPESISVLHSVTHEASTMPHFGCINASIRNA